ncbi:MAG: MCE family protein [Betaproteobacteria bacterium]|nr:MCE family protein [Betaproteobacteria bacterium]
MENQAHALAAGLFTLVLVAALVAAALWLRGEPIAQDRYILHTRGVVSGLNAQADVRYRGVEVGKVDRIRFDSADPRTILVDISVSQGTPITRGTYAELAPQGITGLSYVHLEDDGSSSALRDPADSEQARIELRPSFLERVTGSGEQAIGRIAAVAAKLEIWLDDENRQQALRTLAAFERAAQDVSAVSTALQKSAHAVPELASRAGKTLTNADALIADLRGLAATLDERSRTLERVAASAERIGASVEQVARAGDTLVSVAGNETLPRVHLLLDDLTRSSRSLERLIADLSANPSSVVFGRAALPPGPGEPGFAQGALR